MGMVVRLIECELVLVELFIVAVFCLNRFLFNGSPKTKEPSRGAFACGFAKSHSLGG